MPRGLKPLRFLKDENPLKTLKFKSKGRPRGFKIKEIKRSLIRTIGLKGALMKPFRDRAQQIDCNEEAAVPGAKHLSPHNRMVRAHRGSAA